MGSLVRLLRGISNGFVATACIGLHGLIGRVPGDWLSRCALRAILRMYRFGGGIDEGAWMIFAGWGAAGRETLRLALARNQIPLHQEGIARILATDPAGNES